MLTQTLNSIRKGGEILAQQPARIRQLEHQVTELKAHLSNAIKARDYWIQKHDQVLMECNQFEKAYKITRRRLNRQRKLNNSQPSSKTVAQAQADHDLQQRGL